MTNVERDLQTAVSLLESGQLNDYASSFVHKIRNYDKKDLKKLTSKQFLFLRDIANEKYNI